METSPAYQPASWRQRHGQDLHPQGSVRSHAGLGTIQTRQCAAIPVGYPAGKTALDLPDGPSRRSREQDGECQTFLCHDGGQQQIHLLRIRA